MSNETDTFAHAKRIEQNYLKIFSELCYEVFHKNKQGAQLLALLENKHFRSPVANPAKESSWAFFHEGQNEMIRSFTMGIHTHLQLNAASKKAKESLNEVQGDLLKSKNKKTRIKKD